MGVPNTYLIHIVKSKAKNKSEREKVCFINILKREVRGEGGKGGKGGRSREKVRELCLIFLYVRKRERSERRERAEKKNLSLALR